MIKNEKRNEKLPILLMTLCNSILFTSCNKEELDIQNNFPFEVEARPVPKSLAQNTTVEIRCRLKRENIFSGAQYRIRYFQYDGNGKLSMQKSSEDIWQKCANCIAEPVKDVKKPYLLPNDPYLLPADHFNLYYTSLSEEQQSFTIGIKDNFGNERSMDFEFTSNKN